MVWPVIWPPVLTPRGVPVPGHGSGRQALAGGRDERRCDDDRVAEVIEPDPEPAGGRVGTVDQAGAPGGLGHAAVGGDPDDLALAEAAGQCEQFGGRCLAGGLQVLLVITGR